MTHLYHSIQAVAQFADALEKGGEMIVREEGKEHVYSSQAVIRDLRAVVAAARSVAPVETPRDWASFERRRVAQQRRLHADLKRRSQIPEA